MSEHEVPWAEGRRALVLCDMSERWHEAVGVLDTYGGLTRKAWLCCGPDPDLDAHEWFVDEGAKTALLLNQCPECFEVEEHADGCIVAANIALGVPEFWARWARSGAPPVKGVNAMQGHVYALAGLVHTALGRGCLAEVQYGLHGPVWYASGYSAGVGDTLCVCLGFDGMPTVEPWAKP